MFSSSIGQRAAHEPQLVDRALALGAGVFAVAALATRLGEEAHTAEPVSYVVALVAAASLLWRRRQPVLVVGVAVVSFVVLAWTIGNGAAAGAAATIALYTLARTGERRRRVPLAVVAALALAIPAAALSSDSFASELAGEGALALLPVAVADAVRSRAERLRTLVDTEADRRVAAERLRIARDLHDVVAHGLSTIAVQSGVAAHLLERDPSQAKVALETINDTGKVALEELRAMVGVLRSTDDVPLRPTPADRNDLSELLEGATKAGIAVTVTSSGAFPTDVSDRSVVALHRIVQEALTNVARHAGGAPTELAMHHEHDHVRLTITNDGGAPHATSVASTGVGIIGMTERAEALGGSLQANRTAAGGFEVRARLPYHQRLTPGATP